MTAPNLATRVSTRTRTIQVWPVPEVPCFAGESEPAPDSGPVLIGTSVTDAAPASAPFDTAQLPSCGEKVGGRCVLRSLLGEGAFGRVFAAEDEETGQQVALKVVGLRRYPREYAEHELRALAAIAHPNVVQLNEHGVEAGAPEPYLWYTMPLYQGLDLAALLKHRGHLTLARAHAVFTRIAGGVCEMHRLGLRHQDIKPDNIYLATMAGVAEHHPVLLDLGGAAREHANRPLVATFPFAAPEQTEALIGGLLGEQHAALSEKVDVYALAATLLFSLIGSKFAGHDVAQNDSGVEATPEALTALRSQLARIHAARALTPLPEEALPGLFGAVRERLSAAFSRWLAVDPLQRPRARQFLEELSVLLEWDSELTRRRQSRELRRKLVAVSAGLSLAAGMGGFIGYQWHKRTMGEAKQATNAALKKADAASDELHRAGTTLDKIIADPSLGAVEKARRITEVVEALEAQTERMALANERLAQEQKNAEREARLRAQQEKAAFDAALEKAEGERAAAKSAQATAETAAWKAEAERDQARNDQAAADAARAKAERERLLAQQDKAAADAARAKVESDRDRLEGEKSAAETAKLNAQAELALARQNKAAEDKAAFDRGVEVGYGKRRPSQ
ncbi:MAG TPA: protein kinase [Polyangiaceae bacterium]|nr:protein kinase [Polyangiaceae bacterium]